MAAPSPEVITKKTAANDCMTVRPLPTLQFITLAEYDGTNNVSLDAWKKAGRLHVDDGSLLIVCVDPQRLDAHPDYAQKMISFEARIGSRAIEVQNYTEVGKQTDAVRVGLRTVMLPELRTFMWRVNAITSSDDPTIVTKSEEVLESLSYVTSTATLRDATSLILGTSGGELSSLRQTLHRAVELLRQASSSMESTSSRLPRARQQALDATAALRQAETLLQAARSTEQEARDTADRLRGTPAISDEEIAKAEARVQSAGSERATREQNLRVAAQDSETRNRTLAEMQAEYGAAEAAERQSRSTISAAIQALRKRFPAREEDLRTAVNLSSEVPNGFIDLRSQDAKAGDVLHINMRVYSDESATTYRTVPLPPLHIRDFGFATRVSPSFLLVKRSSEPEEATNSTNFKGAAGVSLLFSHTARSVDRFRRLANGISGGINVSYLDFDPSQNLEIGAGPVVGLFRDRVHAGFGWNLNVASNRFYYYLGFSFADLQGNRAGESRARVTE
jgi:hypothetical protein